MKFEAIVRKHQSMLYRIAYNFFHNVSVAEEVVQDVFLELHKRERPLESEGHLTAWLRQAAVHRCIDILRRRNKYLEEPLEGLPEVASVDVEVDPLLDEKLHQMVASLPDNQRAVVVLRYGEDLSSEDIGRLLNMPAATVRSHLQRALAMLREKAQRVLGEEVHGRIRRQSS